MHLNGLWRCLRAADHNQQVDVSPFVDTANVVEVGSV